MNTETREPQSPESYSTFWQPLTTTPAPVPASPATATAEPKDAYLEFTEVTEGSPAKTDRT